jgi:curli biogenesis system outer membrane secretion channel CsgG
MKKLNLLFLAAFILFVCCASSSQTNLPDDNSDLYLNLPPYSGEKLTIAVLDLNNQTEFDDPRIGRGISNMLITALVNSDRYTVVERNPEVMQKLLEEQALGLSGVIDPQTAARVGRILGASGVVIGEVTEFGIRKTGAYVGFGGKKTITTRVVIDVRMVEVETGRILMAAPGIGQSSTQTAGVALTFEFGTAGFDETTIGMATRKAVNQVVKRFAAVEDKKTNQS